LTKEFHQAMGELVKVDPADEGVKPFLPFIKSYLRVQGELKKAPGGDDPAVKTFQDELAAEGYQPQVSRGGNGHYKLWCKFQKTQNTDELIKHKLARLEEHFESFYYWFAMQRDAEQPALPKYLLPVVMTEPAVYQNRQVSWGVTAPVGDGFTPRRDNVLFLSHQRQDPLYAQLLDRSKQLVEQLKQELNKNGYSADLIVSGKIFDKEYLSKWSKNPNLVNLIGLSDTVLTAMKAFEEDSERQTITYEGTRQLLVASGMFPRHVSVPEWVLTGLASYFETPVQAVYPGMGNASWTHLISFKYFQKAKGSRLAVPADVLYNVLTDRYFEQARRSSELSQEKLGDEKLADKAKEDWELARCTAWAYVYHRVSNGKINELFRYGEELHRLPRDMDLSEKVLQECAARAMGLGERTNASKLDMQGAVRTRAAEWFNAMRDLTLPMVAVQDFHYHQRELQARKAPPPPPPGSGTGSGGLPPPPGFPGKN
jgi:hypothetical protein